MNKHTVNCPHKGDVIKVAGLDFTVTATFPVIRRKDDLDGVVVMAERDGEYIEFTSYDGDDDMEVYR